MTTSGASSGIAVTIGRNIRRARTEKDMTQRQLAVAMDIDVMAVSRWERAEHRPSDDNLLIVASVLGRDFAWFFVDHSEEAARA